MILSNTTRSFQSTRVIEKGLSDFRGGFRGERGGRAPPPPPPHPFFCNHLFFAFCNHFEELQTVLIEVKLVINNAPLTYVYLNTIKTCLTPNHLLFGSQLLYYSNTTSHGVRNLTVLLSAADKINRISNHILDRWRHEYVANLRAKQRTSKLNISSAKNYVVLVYAEKVPRNFWRITIVTGVLSSRDSEIKGAIVRIKMTNAILKRHVNTLPN